MDPQLTKKSLGGLELAPQPRALWVFGLQHASDLLPVGQGLLKTQSIACFAHEVRELVCVAGIAIAPLSSDVLKFSFMWHHRLHHGRRCWIHAIHGVVSRRRHCHRLMQWAYDLENQGLASCLMPL
eukprot:Skav218939  [mRNA]  locus=scaffold678:156631:161636:- [translate_table: standard]